MLPTLRKLFLQYTGLRNRVAFLGQSNLTGLEVLDISGNSFSTTIAPNWFWNSTNLTFLNLKGCGFHGPIPDDIGSMTSLEQISLQRNNLMSTMIPSNFRNLCNLKILDLERSNISGDITELMGRLPDCPPSKMQMLDLSDNNVSGALPNWSGPLTNLTYLVLSINKLTGPIPQWIWSLSDLVILELAGNKLDGIVTEDHLKGLTDLQFLGLDNTLLQIKISQNWIPPFELQALILASLQLGPAFPPWLRSQTSLQLLHISNASITEIPDWFWVAFSRAEFLDLSDNQIAGTLPETLEFMAADIMVLFNNRYTGMVPKFPRNISYMDLSRNSFSGTLPSDFGAPLLQELLLYNNSISGTIPSSICSLSQLAVMDLAFIDLSYNRFSGELPVWMGVELPCLALLRLRHNMFSGKIPDSLVNMNAMARISGYSDVLDQVIISGQGPHMYNSVYDIIEFVEEVPVPTKGRQLEFSRQITYMVIIDLSCNSLTRVIPQGIGALIGLRGLNFSWNSLGGEIPENIGELKQLESLDLSNNELSGEIPSSMTALTSLSHVNLSYNTLSGKIPFGNQLGTFDVSSYIGNIGLCGFPLTKSCPGNELSPPADADDGDGLEDISLYLGFTVGFVLGLWVIFCVMRLPEQQHP